MRFLLTMAAAALVAAAWPATAGAQITVDAFVMTLEPADEPVTLRIPFRNETDRSFTVVVELNDWSRNADGGHVFHALGSGPSSCGSRVSVSDEPLHVEAGAAASIRLRYAGRAGDECRVMVWLRTTESFDDAEQESINLIIRTGVKVLVESG